MRSHKLVQFMGTHVLISEDEVPGNLVLSLDSTKSEENRPGLPSDFVEANRLSGRPCSTVVPWLQIIKQKMRKINNRNKEGKTTTMPKKHKTEIV